MSIIKEYKEKYAGTYGSPVDIHVVKHLLAKFKVSDETYIQWLAETNGGLIISNWYDGIDELQDSQDKLASEPWNIKSFVIGWDGSGNPIALLPDNSIHVEYANLGGTQQLAKDFAQLLKQGVSS